MKTAFAALAAIALSGSAAAFDTSTCPTYFVGTWAFEYQAGASGPARMVTFGADGSYLVNEGGQEMIASWTAAPKDPDGCLLNLKFEGGEGSIDVVVHDADTFSSPKDNGKFRRT